MASAGDAGRVLAEVTALASGSRVDANQVPRVDFKHGNVPPLPTNTVPAVGGNQAATITAVKDAGFKTSVASGANTVSPSTGTSKRLGSTVTVG